MKSRSTRLAAVCIALLCAVALHGCSDPKNAAAGTYEVDKAALKAAAEASVKAKGENDPSNMGAGMMMGMIDAMVMTMNLNADGSASIQTNMMGQSNTTSGTWTIVGSTITITAAEKGGTPKPITATISGDTITLKPPKEQKMPFELVFKKKVG